MRTVLSSVVCLFILSSSVFAAVDKERFERGKKMYDYVQKYGTAKKLEAIQKFNPPDRSFMQGWDDIDYYVTNDPDLQRKLASEREAERWTQARIAEGNRKADNALMMVVVPLLFLVGGCLYFLPTIVAVRRNHPQKNAIFVLDLFLGWTLLGWVVALVWALSKATRPVVNQTFVPSPATDREAELRSLVALKSDGLISDKEFQEKRSAVLARI